MAQHATDCRVESLDVAQKKFSWCRVDLTEIPYKPFDEQAEGLVCLATLRIMRPTGSRNSKSHCDLSGIFPTSAGAKGTLATGGANKARLTRSIVAAI